MTAGEPDAEPDLETDQQTSDDQSPRAGPDARAMYLGQTVYRIPSRLPNTSHKARTR